MCGIFCFIGKKPVATMAVVEGLTSLEHRGYDSLGMLRLVKSGVETYKISRQEKEDFSALDLLNIIPDNLEPSALAIGHNRWATFGRVSRENAHPHHDSSKRIYVVHNGNVENLLEVEERAGNWARYSETDTEAIANLIAKLIDEKSSFPEAVKRAIGFIEGANVIAVFNADEPDLLVVANRGGTILLGQNGNGNIIASDPAAFESFDIKKQKEVGDNEIAIVRADGWSLSSADAEELAEEKEAKAAQKKEFSYFMEEEIFGQPESFFNALRGRIIRDQGITHFDCATDLYRELRKVETFHFVGCGTAYNACQYASLLFNRFGMAARPWVASEFCYSHPIFKPNDAFIFISQSGETADTLEVVKEIKLKGNICLGIVNAAGSRIWREVQAGIGIRAGKERGVASTKAYTSQLASIVMLAVFLARQRSMTIDTGQKILNELEAMPEKIKKILSDSGRIKDLAKRYSHFKNYYFLGRYFSSVTAYEGSLKLKEISYVHAEAYPLGEMKHGPLALIDERFCSIAVVPNDPVGKKSIVNLHEIKSRHGNILAIGNESMPIGVADAAIYVPETLDFLSPILTVIPLQLFAYYMSLELGKNPDKPRNLAKTVTVN